jgi:hypothetical protein
MQEKAEKQRNWPSGRTRIARFASICWLTADFMSDLTEIPPLYDSEVDESVLGIGVQQGYGRGVPHF